GGTKGPLRIRGQGGKELWLPGRSRAVRCALEGWSGLVRSRPQIVQVQCEGTEAVLGAGVARSTGSRRRLAIRTGPTYLGRDASLFDTTGSTSGDARPGQRSSFATGRQQCGQRLAGDTATIARRLSENRGV